MAPPGTGSWDIIDFNPYDNEKLASVTIATVDEVDAAYRAAERAQKQWAATNPYARRAVFEKVLRLVEDREAEISEAIIAELGGTRLKAAFELHLAKEFLREAVHLSLRPEGGSSPRRSTARRTASTGCRSVSWASSAPSTSPSSSPEVGRPGPRPRQRRRPQAAPEHADRRRHP